MDIRSAVFLLLALVALPGTSFAQDEIAPLASLQVMYGETLDDIYYAGIHMPLEMHGLEDAEGMFSEASMAILSESVDWEEQYVLIFGWNGSGSVSFSHSLIESMPPHVTFTQHVPRVLKGNLHRHNYVYVLRNDVEWTLEN